MDSEGQVLVGGGVGAEQGGIGFANHFVSGRLWDSRVEEQV